jgi:hypothetical protein
MNGQKMRITILCFLLGAVPGAHTITAAGVKHYLYVATAPGGTAGPSVTRAVINVYDMDNGHELVNTISLPSSAFAVRGIWANAATNRLYISDYGDPTRDDIGQLVALDLTTNNAIWTAQFSPSLGSSAVDRGCVSPDGSTIYLPSGESVSSDYWYVINAATGREDPSKRIHVSPNAHNTICSATGKVFMSPVGNPSMPSSQFIMAVYDPASGQKTVIGPFGNRVRPFTINVDGSLIFANINSWVGFEVADANSGKILYSRVQPPGYSQPNQSQSSQPSHGIALTPDCKEVWVADNLMHGIHVWDVSNVPAAAPVYRVFIPTAPTGGSYAAPGWIMTSIDGKYMYPETMEVISTASHQVIGQLLNESGGRMSSRYSVEIDLSNGVPVAVGDQFGIGRSPSSAANSKLQPPSNLRATVQ